MTGLIHIYCGDGKGKTTAAVGLSVRASGCGKKTIFAQFLKDGTSSEMTVLNKIENIKVCVCGSHCGFLRNMSEAEISETKRRFENLLSEVLDMCENDTDLLVLDEIIAACNNKIVDEERLLKFLKEKPNGLEVVMTGRNPSESLISVADYVTEMKKIKHPYDNGIVARLGIEY